jgi:hypothetical protein
VNKPALLLLVGLLAPACSPYLSVVTPAPPNRVVRLNHETDRIEVSEGVAIAVECYRQGSPCRGVVASVTDPTLVQVLPAHMSKLTRGYGDEANVTTLALVGLKPGATKLRVWSQGWTRDYDLKVHPAGP